MNDEKIKLTWHMAIWVPFEVNLSSEPQGMNTVLALGKGLDKVMYVAVHSIMSRNEATRSFIC